MHDAKDEYIYQLRVERAVRNRQIYAEAQLKDVATQTWADLSARGLTYEIWHDDEDWEVKMQALSVKSEAHTISFSNIERSGEFTEQCRQAENKRQTGE